MSDHTPGPWSIPHFAEPDAGCECGYVLTESMMGAVCTVHASGEADGTWANGDNPKFEQACANAYLIAAAPEMFKALCAVIVHLEHGDKTDWLYATTLARAAIAKARGES